MEVHLATGGIMANRDDKVAGNVPGPFYVDSGCIDCRVCIEIAPAHFAANEDEGHAFMSRQPETEAERALCHEAMGECPVEAIGEDGYQRTP